MARNKHRIVEPSDAPSGDTEAIGTFIDAGWPQEDAAWLGPLCRSTLESYTPDSDDIARINLATLAKAWSPSDLRHSRDYALLTAWARLCGLGGKGQHLARPSTRRDYAMDSAHCTKISKTFRAQSTGFERALVTGGWPGDYGSDAELNGELTLLASERIHKEQEMPEVVRLMRRLVLCADLDLTAVVDLDALTAIGSARTMLDPVLQPRVPAQVNRDRPLIADARSLTTWMIALGPDALSRILPAFVRCANDRQLAALAVGVQDSIEKWVFLRTGHWTHILRAGPELAKACEPFLQQLERRSVAADAETKPYLRRAWLWFALCVYESDRKRWQELPDDSRETVLRAANEDLAGLRPLLARARPKPRTIGRSPESLLLPGETREPWEEFECERAHFDTCVMLLYEFGGVWRGMKALLLAMRALACPAVAKDLRYWSESAQQQRPVVAPDELDQPPEPWAVIPGSMIRLFHAFVGREQADDRELIALRGELAKFCLERLADRWTKTERDEAARKGRKRSDEDMVERSAVWRLCLIRAAAALHINPEAKGHRILHQCERHDPDDDVREAAHAAYQQIRRQQGLPENLSPRRAIMTALWWIRQAHLLGLGIEPDPDGAQRTRVKELTRTKEAERVANPASEEL